MESQVKIIHIYFRKVTNTSYQNKDKSSITIKLRGYKVKRYVPNKHESFNQFSVDQISSQYFKI